MNPSVSIVLPVYNSSNTLIECLDSLVNQTLIDIEIICIDDNSSDNSVSMIEDFMKIDHRVKLFIHSKNCGTLKTRYDGVMASIGKYIMFVDADDLLENNACESLSKLMEKTGADIIQFGTTITSDNVSDEYVRGFSEFLKPVCKSYYGEEVFKNQFNGICWHLWNRIFDAELCKKAYRCAGEQYLIYSDDLYVSFFISYYSKHFESVIEKYYVYRPGLGMSSSMDNYHLLQTICENSNYIYRCIDFLKENGKNAEIDTYCFNKPLLEIWHSFEIWNQIEDEGLRNKGFELIKKTWNNRTFGSIYRQLKREYNPSWISKLWRSF